jgi:trigger factor
LEVKTEPLENCEVLMTMELDQAQNDRLLKEAARRISRKAKIPGFRPGKAPFNVVVQRFGLEVVQEEALEEIDSLYKEALEELALEPYGPGQLEEVGWDPLKITVRIPTPPEIELGGYRDMRLEYPAIEVDEEEVERALEELQANHTDWQPVGRPAQIGDRITCDVEGYVDGELVLDREGANFLLVERDPNSHGVSISEHVVGMTVDQEREFTLEYPDHPDNEELAGKEMQVYLQLLLVEEGIFPPLDDDLAQIMGDFDTLEELRDSIRQRLQDKAEREADEQLVEEALEKIVENAERIAYPPLMLEEEIDAVLEEHDRRLQRENFSLEAWLKVEGKTEEEFRQEMQPVAEQRLPRALVISKLADLEKLELDPDEIAQRMARLTIAAGEQGPEMREMLQTPEGFHYLMNSAMIDKVKERLVAIVKGQAPSLDELDELRELDKLDELGDPDELREIDKLHEEGEETEREET